MIRSLFYSHYDDEVGFVGFCFVLETGAHCVVLAGLELTLETRVVLHLQTFTSVCLCEYGMQTRFQAGSHGNIAHQIPSGPADVTLTCQ